MGAVGRTKKAKDYEKLYCMRGQMRRKVDRSSGLCYNLAGVTGWKRDHDMPSAPVAQSAVSGMTHFRGSISVTDRDYSSSAGGFAKGEANYVQLSGRSFRGPTVNLSMQQLNSFLNFRRLAICAEFRI